MENYRVSTLPQMVATLPYLLGYVPKDALVAICFQDRRLTVTIAWRDRADTLTEDRDGVRMALSRAVDAGSNHVILVSVDAEDGAERIDLAAAVAGEVGMAVRHRASVVSSILRDLDTGDVCDVPPLSAGEAAPFVLGGVAPLPSREDIAALFEATTTDDVTTALAETGHTLTGSVEAWAAILDTEGEPVEALPAETIARAATALLDVSTRDGLLWRMIPGTPESVALGMSPTTRAAIETLPAPASVAESVSVAERLRVMATRMRDEDATPILTAVAAIYWAAGDGARAACAIDRALRAHPAYTLARMVRTMVAHGVRPDYALA